jgi:aspartyl-tRNA(Asn)/glutamyl-tRNA(Gln) amidotransferase subunit C
MKLSETVLKDIAELAQLSFDQSALPGISASMADILDLVEQMQTVDTENVQPMSNPMDATQKLRPDIVSESDQRDDFQAIAPEIQDGLYLVPRVVE